MTFLINGLPPRDLLLLTASASLTLDGRCTMGTWTALFVVSRFKQVCLFCVSVFAASTIFVVLRFKQVCLFSVTFCASALSKGAVTGIFTTGSDAASTVTLGTLSGAAAVTFNCGSSACFVL